MQQHREGVWVVLGLAFVLLAAFPYFEAVRNANELPRLIQAMSLVEGGEWAIDGPSRRGIAVGPDVARSPVDERIYPNKPPGASLVGAVAYVIARWGPEPPTLREFTWWARLLAGVVPVLLLAAAGWRRLSAEFDGPTATAAVVLGCLGTPLFVYGRLFYGHALAAALLYLGVLGLERGLAQEAERGPRAGWIWVALGGGTASAAITVEYGAAFAGLPIAVALLVAWARAPRRLSGLVAVALGAALVPVCSLAAYHHAVYGSALATGYHHAADPGFAELHSQGLLGLGSPRWENVETHLLSPSTGLIVWSPLALLALGGLIRGSMSADGARARASRLRLGIFTVIALMGLGLSFQGGWRVGPRYLVVALPMLWRGVAELFDALRARLRRPDLGSGDGGGLAHLGLLLAVFVGGAVATLSLVSNALAATMWPHIDATNIGEPFGEVLLPLWRGGATPYGLPALFSGGTAACIALPAFLGFAVSTRAVLGAVPAGARGARTNRALLVLALISAGFVANFALLVSLPAAVEDAPKSQRNLQYIRGVYEPRGRTGDPPRERSRTLDRL